MEEEKVSKFMVVALFIVSLGIFAYFIDTLIERHNNRKEVPTELIILEVIRKDQYCNCKQALIEFNGSVRTIDVSNAFYAHYKGKKLPMSETIDISPNDLYDLSYWRPFLLTIIVQIALAIWVMNVGLPHNFVNETIWAPMIVIPLILAIAQPLLALFM